MANNLMSAKMLETSANAISAYVVIRMFERDAKVKESYGDQSFDYWKGFVGQLVKELSFAIGESKPELFAAKIKWEKAAFQSRNLDESLLLLAMDCILEIVSEELPDATVMAEDIIGTAKQNFSQSIEVEAGLDTDDPVTLLAGQYLVKILEGDAHAAIKTVVEAQQNELTLEESYLALMKAQSEVGRMWHVAEISIAEEHLVTHTTHRAMSALNYLAKRSEAKGKTLISSAVEGNYHDLGIRAVTDFFEFDGWRVICLGNDTPPLEISDAVNTFDASLVMLSANMSAHLNSTRKTIEMVRNSSPNCKILLGGEIFREMPDLTTSLGADGSAFGLTESVQLGNQLCGV